ncbi:MAG TPA: glycosyltransferase [Bryobacteraceae bacterium]|jgi:glycosyltransferase involved in cell wall biosynthesis|nr:glycosyltransferase [Bryobacteraceae bacterium]
MPKPCPVLLMTRSLGLGGTERQVTEIAKVLDRSQFEPHVGCFEAEGFRAEELRAAGVPVVQFQMPSFLSQALFTGARAVGRYLREHAIQLVHTFDVPLNLFGVPAARFYRTPRVISSQRAFRGLTPGLRRYLLRLTDQLVDGIVVNSDAVRRDLIDNDRVPSSLIHLCYNGIDTGLFHPSERPREGPVVIGILCALRPEKGIETLIEAFGQLTSRTDARLRIVGSGPALAGLQGLAARLALGDRCVFEPATRAVAEALRRIDIFALPSLSESFSNSLMEAMACGCCVVASRVGGNPELVVDRETGLLFPALDTAELARCLDLLLRDRDLRRGLAAAGTCRIREQFTTARAAETMAAIYRGVLEG